MATILADDEQALLVAVANCLIPAREAVPGAGDLGVAATIERALSADPSLRRTFLDGLRAIALAAGERGFAAHEVEEQEAVLRSVEGAEPTFFALLVEHTYRGYYTLPEVQRGLGLSGEPPQPRGYHLAPFDPALLAKQRQRAPFWRRTGEETEGRT